MQKFSQIVAVILAAGRGTRMKSQKNKNLTLLGGKPLVSHALSKLKRVKIHKIICVIGYQENQMRKVLGKDCDFVLQEPQLGTGHAVLLSLPYISKKYQTVMIVNADDCAFYKNQTITNLVSDHQSSKVKMTILTSDQKGTNVWGRVIRDKNGQMIGIKSNSEMTKKELSKNHEIVCGIYLFNHTWLAKNLPKVKKAKSGEYLLTSLIQKALEERSIKDVKLYDQKEWQGINTPKELAKARRLWRKIYDK